MNIATRIDTLVNDFKSFDNWEDKYKSIIEKGKTLPDFPEEHRLDQFKVKGCQSQVWLFPELDGDKIKFHADSDASIVKGIIAILLSVYSGATPTEILATKPDFIDEIGLRQHLSMSRANGLNSMLKQISMYAIAFQHQLKS